MSVEPRYRRVFLIDESGNIINDGNPLAVKVGDGTDYADIIPVDGYNGLVAVAPGHVSTDNSTSTVLDVDEVYTGTWEDVTNFGVIVLTVNASHASATDGLMMEFSSDGTNIDSDDSFTIPATTGKTFSFQTANKYYRVKYTNGGTLQTYFRLQTVLKPYYVKPSSHRIQDSIVSEDDAELVKAVITGENPGGTFVNFQGTTKGNFKISVEEFDDAFLTDPLPIIPSVGDEKRNYVYEDNSFVTGDSPVVHDVETDLGRTGIDGYIVNDGGGDMQVEISNNGTDYGSAATIKDCEVYDLQGLTISKIRITWIADTSYRVNVI